MAFNDPVTRPDVRTAGVATRNEAVFLDLQRTLTQLGMTRVMHLTPEQILAGPELFWVVDGRLPGAARLILALQKAGRRAGVAVSSADAIQFNAFCHSSGVHALLMHHPAEPAVPAPESPLTAREIQILQLLADGAGNAEIGQLLHLSPLTIKSHLARMIHKTGAAGRANLVCRGLREGLIS